MNTVDHLIKAQAAFKEFVRRRVPNPEVADDLLQHGLMKAIEAIPNLRNAESVVPWFYRLLRHTIVDYYRSHAADDRKHEAFLRELIASEGDTEPPLDKIPPEVCRCLNRLLPTLRPAFADILQRIDLGGEPLQLVAKDLHVTPNNLTVRLHRARQALRTSLEQVCGVCAKHGCLNCTCSS